MLATIHINHSDVMIFGNKCELYGLIAVIGAVVITFINTIILAKQRGMNKNLVFRLTMVILFGGVAFHVFFQNMIPLRLLNYSYMISVLSLPFIFGMGGHIFGADKKVFTELCWSYCFL